MPVGVDPERRHFLEVSPELEDDLLAALAGLPREPVLQLLRGVTASTIVEEREASVRVLGRIGTKEHLDLLANLGGPVGSAGLVPPKVRASFQEALALILARDSKAFSQLPDLYARMPPALIFPMIRAAESEAPLQTVEMLAALLGARPEADLFLLSEMARLADAVSIPTSRAVRLKPRRYLSDSDSERLQAAVTVAGALEDYDAIPDLTRLLDHHDPQIARCARTALKRIARKDLGRRPEEWASWYLAESEWWSKKSSSTAQDLRGKDPVKASGAILELGSRRLRRDEAALLLTEGLLRPETDLVCVCCQALAHLRSPLAVPALELAQRHENATVRKSAGEALALISQPRGGLTAIRTAHKSH